MMFLALKNGGALQNTKACSQEIETQPLLAFEKSRVREYGVPEHLFEMEQ